MNIHKTHLLQCHPFYQEKKMLERHDDNKQDIRTKIQVIDWNKSIHTCCNSVTFSLSPFIIVKSSHTSTNYYQQFKDREREASTLCEEVFVYSSKKIETSSLFPFLFTCITSMKLSFSLSHSQYLYIHQIIYKEVHPVIFNIIHVLPP